MSTTASPTEVTPEARTAALEKYLLIATGQGWRVQSQGPYSAQLLKGKPTNHILHLILSVITLGAWLIVWALVAIFAGQKQRHVTVDAYGNVHES